MRKKGKLNKNNPIKICLVSLAFFPDKKDGSAKIATSIYNYLNDNGYNIKVITAKWNVDLKDPNIIQINIIRKRFFWFPQFILSVFRILNKQKFDIIHGNGSRVSIPFLFRKYLTTIHDLGPFETSFSKIPILPMLEKLNAFRAKKIITPSNIIRMGLKYYIRRLDIKKIICVYNPIDPKFKPYPKQGFSLKEKLNLKGRTILYIGRIAFYKGIDDIIKAYHLVKKEIPDLNLVIGGKPTLKMASIYQSWKEKYKDIKFVGIIPEKKIQHYYSMADVFVTYSNASEGFGLTPIESIACGTPVICSNLPAYREILGDNAIFVPPKEPELLAEKIKYYFKKEEIKKNLINKSKDVIKKYSMESFGKNLLDIYQEFLKI